MAGPYQRVASGDPGNSGATSAVALVNAHSDGLEALEATDGVVGAWVAGVDYPVGKVVLHEGDAWMLTADDTANGYTTKVSVVAQQSRDVVASSANQTWTGTLPRLITNDAVVCFVIYSQTAAANVTASVGTEVSGSAVNMSYDSKNTGVKVFYSTGSAPTVNLNGGTARITWVHVRGINTSTGPTAVQTSAAAAPTNAASIQAASSSGADGYLALVGTSFARSSGGARGWVGEGGEHGVRIGRGHAFESASAALFDDKWIPWVSSFVRSETTSYSGTRYDVSLNFNSLALAGSAQRVASVVQFAPATNGHPFFDRSKWKRLTGEGRPTATVDADDLAFGWTRIRLPEPDKTYTINLSARTSGMTGGTTTLWLPEMSEAEMAVHHSLRVIVRVSDVRRMLVFRGMRSIKVENGTAPSHGAIYPGTLVEFGSEPGSVSWIDLHFDPQFKIWAVTDSGGDRIMREHRMYTEERRGGLIPEIGFPLYFAPEVSSSLQTQVANTLLWIPTGVRRMLGSRGMTVEVGLSVNDLWFERNTDTDNAGSYTLGQADRGNLTAFGTTGIQNLTEGWIPLHEIGHIVDYEWSSAFNTGKWRQGAPWSSMGTIPYNILNEAFYDEIIAASDNAGIYAYAFSGYGEYFAEIFATSMCAQRYADTGLNYASFSSGKTGIVGSGDPDNLWPGIEAKMKSFGLITYTGNVT